MKVSKFTQKFAVQTGIGQLMDDLTVPVASGRRIHMLGGGTPSHIPSVQRYFRDSMKRLLDDGILFDRALSNYDPPRGNSAFREALADLMKDRFGWNIQASNIALTHGSQQAFFVLFNMFAGEYTDGSRKKILFPMTPEYIGYCDVGLSNDLFESALPSIEFQDDLFFKYHINFDHLDIHDDIGAICVSRPTNPTGNVLTDTEIKRLAQLANERNVPLIIDNAYGKPFPDIVFTDVQPYWDTNSIVCMSLSKLGMPGTRTGIVIGPEDIIEQISRINTVLTLAPSSFGTAIATDMVRTGKILTVSKELIRSFYHEKMEIAVELARTHFSGLNAMIHRPEGAFFLWVWFKNLKVSSHQLYERLKEKDVIVVPGNYFFFGLGQEHPHQNQCIRINHAQSTETTEAGFRIIAEEVEKLSR